MADYYPILARAVSGLATNNAQARQELYEHARTVLVGHLDRSDPQISLQEMISERMALETAVQGVEAKFRSIPERSPETLTNRLDALLELHGDKEPTRPSLPRRHLHFSFA
jgi:hypothetical protein